MPDRKFQVLWVDDNPENQAYERGALEAMNIVFTLAPSTKKAVALIEQHEYDAIISDMHRLEGSEEGYVLLEEVRSRGLICPFFLYTGSATREERQEILRRGGQGRTKYVQDLFKMVLYVTLLGVASKA